MARAGINTRVQASPPRRSCRLYYVLGRLVLPWLVGSFILYFAVHSPFREIIASALGMESRGCFFCTYAITIEQVVNSFSAIILLVAAVFAGWIAAERFEASSYDRVLAFGLYAFAFLTAPSAIIGLVAYWLGAGLLRPPGGPLLAAIPAATVVLAGVWRGWRPSRIHLDLGRPSPLLLFIAGLATVLLMSSAAISLMHPPTSYDALGYHGPMAVFLWQDGNLGTFLDRAPSIWALAHPGMAELWIGLLQIAGGETLSQLAQTPFVILAAAGVYAFTRRLGLRRGAAQLAAASFLLVPMVVVQSSMKLNDLTGAALLIATVALASAPIQHWNTSRFALVGTGLGLAVTTKLALLPGAAGLVLFVLLALWHNSRLLTTRTAIRLVILAICFLILVAPWWTRNIVHYENPVYPAALPLLGQGHSFVSSTKADAAFVPRRLAWLIYPFIEIHDDQSGLGALFAVSAVVGFATAAWRGRRHPLILFSFIAVLMLPSWWFLSERFPRFLLVLAGLATAFVPWSLLAVPRRWRWMGLTLLALAAVVSAWVTFDQALLPFARQPITRPEFYDQVWAVDPGPQALPEKEGILYQTGYAPTIPEYAGYYPLLGPSLGRLVLPVDRESTNTSIIERMRRYGIHYAYVNISPENQEQVDKLFDRASFELVSQSRITAGEATGPRRHLFRTIMSGNERDAVQRRVYRLR